MIVITTNAGEVAKNINRITIRIPQKAEEGLEELAKYAQAEYKRELTLQRLKWTGLLHMSIQATKIKNDTYGIMMADYGIYLDRAAPHVVSPFRYPELESWCLDKLGFVPKALTVKPHPWLAKPTKKVTDRAKFIVENKIKEVR